MVLKNGTLRVINTMNESESTLEQSLHLALQEAESEFDFAPLDVKEKEIETFCSIINDFNPVYHDSEAAKLSGFKGKIIPPGYIMSLATQIIYKIFIKIGPLFASKIRGVIHVSSEVEYFKPMPIENTYKISIKTSVPKKKEGSKGNYYKIFFKTFVYDDIKEITAIDNHLFFLKI